MNAFGMAKPAETSAVANSAGIRNLGNMCNLITILGASVRNQAALRNIANVIKMERDVAASASV